MKIKGAEQLQNLSMVILLSRMKVQGNQFQAKTCRPNISKLQTLRTIHVIFEKLNLKAHQEQFMQIGMIKIPENIILKKLDQAFQKQSFKKFLQQEIKLLLLLKPSSKEQPKLIRHSVCRHQADLTCSLKVLSCCKAFQKKFQNLGLSSELNMF